MKTYILSKSTKKNKKYKIDMGDMSHDFGSKTGKTFIDHKNLKKKSDWKARHKKDKNYKSQHSGIYHSRNLLWNKPTIEKSIKDYEKKHRVKIINKI